MGNRGRPGAKVSPAPPSFTRPLTPALPTVGVLPRGGGTSPGLAEASARPTTSRFTAEQTEVPSGGSHGGVFWARTGVCPLGAGVPQAYPRSPMEGPEESRSLGPAPWGPALGEGCRVGSLRGLSVAPHLGCGVGRCSYGRGFRAGTRREAPGSWGQQAWRLTLAWPRGDPGRPSAQSRRLPPLTAGGSQQAL